MASPHDVDSPAIILATLNAKYIPASLGLRYLLANMGKLKPRTVLREFTIARKPQEIVDELLAVLGAPSVGAVQIMGPPEQVKQVLRMVVILFLIRSLRTSSYLLNTK